MYVPFHYHIPRDSSAEDPDTEEAVKRRTWVVESHIWEQPPSVFVFPALRPDLAICCLVQDFSSPRGSTVFVNQGLTRSYYSNCWDVTSYQFDMPKPLPQPWWWCGSTNWQWELPLSSWSNLSRKQKEKHNLKVFIKFYKISRGYVSILWYWGKPTAQMSSDLLCFCLGWSAVQYEVLKQWMMAPRQGPGRMPSFPLPSS